MCSRPTSAPFGPARILIGSHTADRGSRDTFATVGRSLRGTMNRPTRRMPRKRISSFPTLGGERVRRVAAQHSLSPGFNGVSGKRIIIRGLPIAAEPLLFES